MIDEVDIDETLISNKVSSGEENYEYFISYKDDDYKVKPLCIMLPKISRYVKSYDDETKCMSAILLKRNLIANQYSMKNI